MPQTIPKNNPMVKKLFFQPTRYGKTTMAALAHQQLRDNIILNGGLPPGEPLYISHETNPRAMQACIENTLTLLSRPKVERIYVDMLPDYSKSRKEERTRAQPKKMKHQVKASKLLLALTNRVVIL